VGWRHGSTAPSSCCWVIVTIIALVAAIGQNPGIRSVLEHVPEEGENTSLILAFLTQFGIVLPVLMLGLGGLFIRLGLQLRKCHVTSADWAQTALLWLAVGLVLAAGLNLLNLIRFVSSSDDAVVDVMQVTPVVLPLLFAILMAAALTWLTRNKETAFHGQQTLSSQETRQAWNMLIPTLAVVILVAARPLEQTFIRSVTDKQFAGQQVPNFVGLDNYANLLGIRLDTVTCRLDEETEACALRKDGSIRWEIIDRPLLEAGYRTVTYIPLSGGGAALAISGLDDDFLEGVWTTLIFTVFSVTFELLIALFMALVVNSNFRGRGFMRAVMLVPWAIPTVISARLWELILKDTSAGIVNRLLLDLQFIDTPQAWLSDPSLQVPAAILIDVWKTSPFMALLLLAGLQTIPKDLYEAARVDGANKINQFFSITLPLLRPTIAVALVFRTLDALRVFDLFNVLFGRQQLSMATYNYEVLVNNQQDGYASAVSMLIFVLISVFAFIYVRILSLETD
jgi:trehalose/maltose transport system permease protein